MTGDEMQAIHALEAAAEAADSGRVDEARTTLRKLIRAAEELAAAPEDAVNRLILVCSTAHGLGSVADKLSKAVKEARAANVIEGPWEGSEVGTLDALPTLSAALTGCPDVPPDLPVPVGYAVTESRIWAQYMEGDFIRYRPIGEGMIAVIGRAWDVETGSVRITLAWRYSGRWVTRCVPRSVALDGRKIMALADDGAPVNGKSAPVVASWLAAQEAAADQILPASTALSRMGWTPDMLGCLIGESSVGARVVHTPVSDGEQMIARSYQRAGTLSGWVAGVWQPVAKHPMGLIVLSAMVPPILPIIGALGWTLDIGGETSTGKTTAMETAASVWGTSGIVKAWPLTWPGVRGVMELCTHVPCFFDDTQMTIDKPELVTRALYAAAFGASQTMGQVGGGLRRERPLCTVIISTGEVSATSVCAAARGATTRLITVNDQPLPPGSAALAESIKAARDANHGVAGMALVEWLHRNRDKWPQIKETYRKLQLSLQATAPSSADGRVMVYVAQLQVAAMIAKDALGIEVPPSMIDRAIRYATDGASARDTPTAALLWARSWWDARPGLQHGARDAREIIGWDIGGDRIGWAEGALRRALTEGGYNPTEILTAWRGRGWLVVGEPGRFSTRIPSTVEPSRPRAVVMSDAAAKVIGEAR